MRQRLWLIGAAACGVGLTLAVGMTFAPPQLTVEVTPSGVVNEDPTPTATPTDLPPCPTEDSEGCYWDAETMGNGIGEDVVTVPAPDPVELPAGGEVNEDAGAAERWVPPCTDYLADHGGVCKGEPLAWPFSNGDTLVCGPDAKPAIDYRDDGVGFWAYCEPALVH